MKLRIRTNPDAFDRLRNCTNAFLITRGDLKGPILIRLGQEHRRQEKRIFASEGREGQAGKWEGLSPAYKASKVRAVGSRRKILVFSGEMKKRFITKSRSEYIQEMIIQKETRRGKITGRQTGVAQAMVRLGARSQIAVHHFEGASSTRRSKPGTGKNKRKSPRTDSEGRFVAFKPKTFSVKLPMRDMVTKTSDQIIALQRVLVRWYQKERLPQILAVCSKELRKVRRPGGTP